MAMASLQHYRYYQFRYFCPAKNSKQTASSKQQEYISSSERLQIRRQSVAQKGKGGCPRQNQAGVVYIVVVPWPRRKRSKQQSSWLSSSSGGSVALEVFSVFFFTYYILLLGATASCCNNVSLQHQSHHSYHIREAQFFH